MDKRDKRSRSVLPLFIPYSFRKLIRRYVRMLLEKPAKVRLFTKPQLHGDFKNRFISFGQ